MGHSIGKGTLQHSFGRDPLKFRSHCKVACHICQRFMEMRYSRSKVGQHGRTVSPAYKERSSVSQNAIHMPNQLMRRTNQKRAPEL